MPTEGDNEMVQEDQIGSPSIDEGSSGRSLSGDGQVLKKGPWTSVEDAILVEYVKKHGEGNWNAVQKNTGLLRCGKSCRLRWANHLRPNLKKGSFTPEEEQLIIKLHARMGNRWARMAAHLPGRTDNEIKNYWNTRIKRRQRAGLPLYPPNTRFQASDENQQTQSVSRVAQQHKEFLQGKCIDIPDIIFDNINTNDGDLSVLSYPSPFPDISLNSRTYHGYESQGYRYMNPVNHVKHLQDFETLDVGCYGTVCGGGPSIEQYPIEPSGNIQLTYGLDYPYDPVPNIKNLTPYVGEIPGSHAFSNGNFSASRPISRAVKLELPSLQYTETDDTSWTACPSTPFLESVDTYVESSPTTVSLQSDCVSPWNSGLLEALLHEAQALSSSKRHSSEKSSSSAITHNEMVDSSALLNLSEAECEEYLDPISPLGHSAAYVFNECAPPIDGSSFHDLAPSTATSGSHDNLDVAEHLSTTNVEEKHISSHPDFSRPDALLESGWLEEGSQGIKDHSILNDAISTLLGQDFCKEYKPSSTLVQEFELESYPWNKMPHVCQMPELP